MMFKVRYRRNLSRSRWIAVCSALGTPSKRLLSADFEDAGYPGDERAWRVIRQLTAWPRRSLRRAWDSGGSREFLFALIVGESVRIQVAPFETTIDKFTLRVRRRTRLLRATVPFYRLAQRLKVWPTR